MCLSGDRAFDQPRLSSSSQPSTEMLTLNQVSILFSKSSCRVPDDDNNNLSSLGCGTFALKMLSCPRAPRLLQRSGVPRRCLFGAPVAADTQRLLREDLDAAKARMSRRWGWDVAKDKPSSSSAWDWETVKIRRHPYHPVSKRAETPNPSSVTSVLNPVSPLPDTPRTLKDSSPAFESSSSGTSTLSASPGSPESPSSFPVLKTPSSWSLDSVDSCCGDSDSDSSNDSALTPCFPTSPSHDVHHVQTRMTDFWRSRRCSISDIGAKNMPTLPTARTSTRTCSV